MFRFKQFTVHHDRCAMKVGTDGVLLGAMAPGGDTILDIGTGTGLCALMMAQRYPHAHVTAIDIDADAASQAADNVASSPFAGRIEVSHCALEHFAPRGLFDAIVCNPPFFEDSLPSPSAQRTAARHTSSLPFAVLFGRSALLLAPHGLMTVIIPTDRLPSIEREASFSGMFVHSRTYIKTSERKQPKRVVVTLGMKPATDIITETHCLADGPERSEWYKGVCGEFYL